MIYMSFGRRKEPHNPKFQSGRIFMTNQLADVALEIVNVLRAITGKINVFRHSRSRRCDSLERARYINGLLPTHNSGD